jgi:hypothetical protein
MPLQRQKLPEALRVRLSIHQRLHQPSLKPPASIHVQPRARFAVISLIKLHSTPDHAQRRAKASKPLRFRMAEVTSSSLVRSTPVSPAKAVRGKPPIFGGRTGAPEPQQEHLALGEHGERGHGAVRGGSRPQGRGGVRAVRRVDPNARTGAGVGDGQPPPYAQGRRGARALVEGWGRELWFPPAYSTIRGASSKVKAPLGKTARTRGAPPAEAMVRAPDEITARDARGWFAPCGYAAVARRS